MNEENKTNLIKHFLICITIIVVLIALFRMIQQVKLKEINVKLKEIEMQEFSFTNKIKSKELEIGVYDQLTYCIKTVMKESRKNNKPASLQEAEKICAKFSKLDAQQLIN